jgi:phage terminase large subunit
MLDSSGKLSFALPEWGVPFLEKTRYKALYGGRGSGKSHFFAELLIFRAVQAKTNAVCIRETQKSLTHSSKRLLEDKIQALGVGHLFELQHDCIKAPFGGVFIFQGMQAHNADSIKSLEGFNVAWVEEAQSLSQHSLDLLRPTIRAVDSELWFSWNPRKETDAIELLFKSPPPNSLIKKVNYYDNKRLPPAMLDEMLWDKSRDTDKYSHVWLGAFISNSEAQVLRNWKVEEFEALSKAYYYFGADWGFNDPTTLIRCFVDGKKLYVDYEAYMVGCDVVDLPRLFLSIPESERYPIVADSAYPSYISHLNKNGFPRVIAATKGAKSIDEGITWLKSFDIIVHPRCKHLIDELTLYSYTVDKATNVVTDRIEDKNNHLIDALRYALEGERRLASAKTVKVSDYRKRRGQFCG